MNNIELIFLNFTLFDITNTGSYHVDIYVTPYICTIGNVNRNIYFVKLFLVVVKMYTKLNRWVTEERKRSGTEGRKWQSYMLLLQYSNVITTQ